MPKTFAQYNICNTVNTADYPLRPLNCSQFTLIHFCLIHTFPIVLNVADRHLRLCDFKESESSRRLIDSAGEPLPGQRDAPLVGGVMVVEIPAPADHVGTPIILSDKLMQQSESTLLIRDMYTHEESDSGFYTAFNVLPKK